MTLIETERLALRELDADDAAFILGLLNEPSFHRYIGDKGVRTLDDARRYIADGPAASYRRNSFGLYRVELKETGVPIGICGLVKRDSLPDPDIGFAFLESHWSKGYALESASAVMAHGRETLGLARILAITDPANTRSVRLLEKIGLRFERLARLRRDATVLRVYSSDGPDRTRAAPHT